MNFNFDSNDISIKDAVNCQSLGYLILNNQKIYPSYRNHTEVEYCLTLPEGEYSGKLVKENCLTGIQETPIIVNVKLHRNYLFSQCGKWVKVDNKNFIRPGSPFVDTFDFNNLLFVSKEGNDANNGTINAPFLTISKALSTVKPGETILVYPGVYTEQLTPYYSGTASLPIRLSCAPGALGKVIVQNPDNMLGEPVVFLGKNNPIQYFHINGLVIIGPKGRAGAPSSEHFKQCGIILRKPDCGLGCNFTNLIVKNNLHCGIKEMGDSGQGFSILGCVIVNNGNSSLDHGIYIPCDNTTIRGNVCDSNAGWGLHLYDNPSKFNVVGNILSFNGYGGLLLAGKYGTVKCNTIYKNGTFGLMYFRKNCMYNNVSCNISAFNPWPSQTNYYQDCAYDNGGGKLGDPTGNQDSFNDYYPSGVSKYLSAFNSVGKDNINVDPIFIDGDRGDLRISSLSPAKGMGALC